MQRLGTPSKYLQVFRYASLRPSRTVARAMSVHDVKKMPKFDEHTEYPDFRPPWVYTGSRLITYVLVPYVVFYSVFVYDFGDREHVFQPARRWAARQKAAFFTPSAEESRILDAERSKASSETRSSETS
ncbi:hypothetical protein ONZ45_g10810 [Pleurotus djamor]|nr:hypothetical protein ONZ45_g10810 [Pleurotus djamor]